MIVDFHTHTYPEKIAAKTVELLMSRSGSITAVNGTLDDLKCSMKRCGVDVSVVLPVATAARQTEKINQTALAVTEQFEQTGVWSFGAIHPDNENYREILHWISDHGLKGIKLHPDYQDAFLNDIRYKRIISCASELGLIVVVHAGVDIGLPDVVHCTPDMAVEILDEIAPDKLVLAHLGGWQMWDEVEQKICGRKVYLDTAFSYGEIMWQPNVEHRWRLASKEQFLGIIKKHGSDKILFATDSPWSDQKQSIDDIMMLPISDEEKKQILGGNAVKLLALKP